MSKRTNSAFDLTDAQLKAGHLAGIVEDRGTLAAWLVQELDNALSTRGTVAQDIRYRWLYYEQGRTRRSSPWPDAADLTSPYATEFVDAILGRLMDTIMVDPLWIVEGWGESTARAPFVEEFHQRAQEQERLQGFLREVLLRALIEPAGVLEITEHVEMRRVRKDIKAALKLDGATQMPIMGEDGQPQLQQDEQGQYVEAQDDQTPHAVTTVDSYEPVRLGPAYDVVPYLDYVRMPTHARTKDEIWGYGKRFFRRVPELKARVAQGVYDEEAVKALGESDERMNQAQSVEAPPSHVMIQETATAQKELWEVPFLADLDGNGDRWWLATVSKEHTQLLRLKVDERSTRFLEFVPFPKPGSRDGYSLVEKMMTLLEEDTAVRNLKADRSSLASAGVVLRQQGALWDPYEQPIGPGQVIDVRDPRELTQFQFTDVPQSVEIWSRNIRTDLERGVGMNDVSVGTQPQERRTLGEVRLAAGYSEVRVKAIITAIQESLEELGQARHDIWIKTLEAMPKGLPAPQSLMQGLDVRGVSMPSLADGRITADMLKGQFWFKPRGSVETANLEMQANNMLEMLKVLPGLIALCPPLHSVFMTPQAAKALLEQMLRVLKWPDKQAFLGSEAQTALGGQFKQMQQQAQQAQMMSDPRVQAMMHLAGGAPQQGQAGPPQMAPEQDAQLQIHLKEIETAGKIEVARIMASKQGADLQREAAEEQLATGLGAPAGPAQGMPPQVAPQLDPHAQLLMRIAQMRQGAGGSPLPPQGPPMSGGMVQ